MVFFNQKVFAVGGSHHCEKMRSVEYYDDYKNEWKKVSSMNDVRAGHAAFVYNNRIYAVGGSGSDSLESYDPSINKWIIVGFPHLIKICVCS